MPKSAQIYPIITLRHANYTLTIHPVLQNLTVGRRLSPRHPSAQGMPTSGRASSGESSGASGAVFAVRPPTPKSPAPRALTVFVPGLGWKCWDRPARGTEPVRLQHLASLTHTAETAAPLAPSATNKLSTTR